jgi:hypothetical protein
LRLTAPIRKYTKALLFVALVLSCSTAQAQTAVTLNGQTKHLKDTSQIVLLDGTEGALTTAMKGTSGHGRFQGSNPVFVRVDGLFNFLGTGAFGYLNAQGAKGQQPLIHGQWAALEWLSRGLSCSDTTYLPVAKWAVTHFEEYTGGTFGVNESDLWGDRGHEGVYQFDRESLTYVAQTYSIVRPCLTSAEIQTFADKVLNDNAVGPNNGSHRGNGLGGNRASLQTDCHNQGLFRSTALGGSPTISVSGGTGNLPPLPWNPGADTPSSITASAPLFDSSWIGAAIFSDGSGGTTNFPYGRIAAVTDSTHATLSRHEAAVSNVIFEFSKVWQQDTGDGIGNCGILWELHHVPFAMRYVVGQESNWPTDYPPGEPSMWPYGSVGEQWIGFNNQTWQTMVGELAVAIALAGDDPRAQTLLTRVYAWLYKFNLPETMSMTTPFTLDGPSYTAGVDMWMYAAIANMLCNSVQESDICTTWTQGTTLKRVAAYFTYMNINFGTGALIDDWGGVPGATPNFTSPNNSDVSRQHHAMCAIQNLYPSDLDVQYMAYYQRTTKSSDFSNNIGSPWANYAYIFCDPAVTQVNISGAPLQFLFNGTDYNLCTANSDFVGYGHCYTNAAISKFVSVNTLGADNQTRVVGEAGWWSGGNHAQGTAAGHYSIYKDQNRLLTFDIQGDTASTDPGADRNSNQIEIGTNTWRAQDATQQYVSYAAIRRWAGNDPHGPSNNKYAYAMVDLLPAGTLTAYTSAANATRVQRHIVHFKENTEYVLDYTDVAVSSPTTIKGYYHYNLTVNAEYSEAVFTAASKTVNLTHTTPGNGKLLSAFISADGTANHAAMFLDNADGSFGGSGWSARATMCGSTDGSTCASVSSAEWIAVHKPSIITSDGMPAITQLAVTAQGGSATAVEIEDGTMPKVWALARRGALVTTMSFTSTHSGTGQYLISGLQPGIYFVAKDGNLVDTFQVSAGDNTLAFDSGSGAFVITQGGFVMGVSPNSAALNPTVSSTVATVTVSPIGSFTGTVTLSAAGLPTGTSVSFSPASIGTQGNSSAKLSTGAGASDGSYPITINGISGNLSFSVPFTLNVSTALFSLSGSSTQSITEGASATYPITLTAVNGFSGTINFSASGLPSGASASFSPANLDGSGTTTLTITTSGSTPLGAYSPLVTASSSTSQSTLTLGLNVNSSTPLPSPSFSLSGSPSQSIVQGGSANYSITVTATSGFSGNINFSAAGLPAGSTATFNPATVAGSSSAVVTIATSSSTLAGAYSPVITGTSSTNQSSVTLGLTVDIASAPPTSTSPTASLTVTTVSGSVTSGQPAEYALTISGSAPVQGVTGVHCSNLPVGYACTVASTSTSGNSMVVVVDIAKSSTASLVAPRTPHVPKGLAQYGLGLVGILFVGTLRKRKTIGLRICAAALALIAAIGTSGCALLQELLDTWPNAQVSISATANVGGSSVTTNAVTVKMTMKNQ